MFRFLLAPRWLALHAAAIALVVGFVALGWWQLGTFRDSSERQDVRAAPAVALNRVAQPGAPLAGAVDRAVTAEGRYLAELIVPARVHAGTLGAYVAAVLQTDDGLLLVLRGWEHDPEEIGPPPASPVTVTGHLVAPEIEAQATGGGRLPPGQLGYLAPEPAAAAVGADLADFYDGYLLTSDERPAAARAPDPLDIDVVAPIRDVSPWQNLSYWAQWWIFAGAVVVFWASFVRSGLKSRRTPPPDQGVPAAPAAQPSAPRRTTSTG